MKILRKIIKISRIVILTICGLLCLFFGTYIVKRIVNENEAVFVCGIGFFRVRSGSMENEIMIGDMVVVCKRNESKYQEGMVVTYQTEDMRTPTTHKIVKRDDRTITTRGIANNADDTPFDVKYIMGEVKFVWHGFDGFMNWLRSAYGILTLLLGAALIFMTSILIDKKIMNEDNQKGGIKR